jgi:mono/diheme cytochrome c family protein
MRRMSSLLAALLFVMFPALVTAQTTIKNVPAKRTSASSGAAMYKEYCASCHGLSGKGDGPAATALKDAPANLTTLSAKNGGKFPDAGIAESIKVGPQVPAHGSAEMPVWGTIFSRMDTAASTGNDVTLRIHNLTDYIKSLQQP